VDLGEQRGQQIEGSRQLYESLKEQAGVLADISLYPPATDTPRVQEAHILAGHIICQLVEEALCGGDHE